MSVPLLGQSAAKVRSQQRTAEETPRVIEATTAFIVYLTPDGRYLRETGLDAPISTARPPTLHEIIAGCAVTAGDVQLQMTSELVTVNVLQNFARMQGDPDFHAMTAQARAQAEAAMHAAAGAAK